MKTTFKKFIATNTRDIKCSKLYVGTNVGINIETAMKEAKDFIYIISPYISSDKIEFFSGLNNVTKKKLILCDTYSVGKTKSSSFSKDTLKILKNLFKKSNFQKYPELVNEKECNMQQKLKNEKKKRNIWLSIFVISTSFLGALFYLKMYPSIYFVLLLFVIFLSLIGIFIYNIRKESIKELFNSEILELKKITPPNMEWKIETKIINSSESPSANYTHLKIYLMDCPKLSKPGNIVTKAFLSSANFTKSGFSYNLEFALETTDFQTTKELLDFFNTLLNHNSCDFHSFNSLVEKLYNENLINH